MNIIIDFNEIKTLKTLKEIEFEIKDKNFKIINLK